LIGRLVIETRCVGAHAFSTNRASGKKVPIEIAIPVVTITLPSLASEWPSNAPELKRPQRGKAGK
jgi:hypothetical protein